MSDTVVPSADRDYYEDYIDWNRFERVVRLHNTSITGDPDVDWYGWLAENNPPFERALALNCGSGWVERALFERGAVKSVVGVDLLPENLATARQAAADLGMPADYIEMDANTDAWPEGPFDLVINHAALHHVAYIDHVVRSLREVIADDGFLVHYDYTGPHRNQYGNESWAATVELNDSFPEHLRHPSLCYPHLPTMLAIDPTEAVHSELILATLDRYFDAQTLTALGGPVAYPLLHANVSLFQERDSVEGQAALERIIDLDRELTLGDPARSLFTFAMMTPRPGALGNADTLARWTEEEQERERRAASSGSEYYPHTAFGIVFCALADEQMKVLHMTVTQGMIETWFDRVRDPRRVLAAVRRRARKYGGRFVRSVRARTRRSA